MDARPHRSRLQSVDAIFAGLIDPIRTEYRGVVMRSRLETDFARHLDAQGIPWRYEPSLFGPKGRGYLPDFEVRADAPTFVEVKPRLRDVPAAQKRMAVVWRTHPDAVLIVACAEGSRYFVAVAGSPWESWVERWAHA
jgi:hypothetical protein